MKLEEHMRALVIDDEDDLRSSLSFFLNDCEFECDESESVDHFMKNHSDKKFHEYHVIVVDENLPGSKKGTDLVHHLRGLKYQGHIFLMTGEVNFKLELNDREKVSVIEKPFNLDNFEQSLKEIRSEKEAS
ncbi:MAG: response regulator [Bacteriovoracaceae bacterium]